MAWDTQLLGQLIERGVGLQADQFAELLLVRRVERRGMAATVGLGGDRAGLTTPAEPAAERRETDAEASRELTLRTLVAIDGSDDALTEVYRIGFHGVSPRDHSLSFILGCS